MKLIKRLFSITFIAVLFAACSKTNDSVSPLQNNPNTEGVSLKNGVVTFNTMQTYLTVTENKNGEQQKVLNKLTVQGFKALSTRQRTSTTITNANNNSLLPTISSTTFNPELYSSYLLSILNADKICSINGFYVKVDMDNVFCSAIDAALPNAYNDLKDNSFAANANIMTFTHPNEPVTEVLQKIRNGEMTWAQYQIELSNAKGGQGICFKSGKENQSKQTYAPTIYPDGTFSFAEARYGKYFLHFELVGASYFKNEWQYSYCFTKVEYEWAGVCKGGGTAVINDGQHFGLKYFVIYSGGSALKLTKLRVTTSLGILANQYVAIASIGY